MAVYPALFRDELVSAKINWGAEGLGWGGGWTLRGRNGRSFARSDVRMDGWKFPRVL